MRDVRFFSPRGQAQPLPADDRDVGIAKLILLLALTMNLLGVTFGVIGGVI